MFKVERVSELNSHSDLLYYCPIMLCDPPPANAEILTQNRQGASLSTGSADFCLSRTTEIAPRLTLSKRSGYIYCAVPMSHLLASTLTHATLPCTYRRKAEYQTFGGMI